MQEILQGGEKIVKVIYSVRDPRFCFSETIDEHIPFSSVTALREVQNMWLRNDFLVDEPKHPLSIWLANLAQSEDVPPFLWQSKGPFEYRADIVR